MKTDRLATIAAAARKLSPLSAALNVRDTFRAGLHTGGRMPSPAPVRMVPGVRHA